MIICSFPISPSLLWVYLLVYGLLLCISNRFAMGRQQSNDDSLTPLFQALLKCPQWLPKSHIPNTSFKALKSSVPGYVLSLFCPAPCLPMLYTLLSFTTHLSWSLQPPGLPPSTTSRNSRCPGHVAFTGIILDNPSKNYLLLPQLHI